MEKLKPIRKGKDHSPVNGRGHYQEGDEHLVRYVYPQEWAGYRLGRVRHVIQHPQDLEMLSVFLHTPFTQEITRNWLEAVITEEVIRSPSPQLEELLRLDPISMISLKDSGNTDLSDCYHMMFARDAPKRRSAPEQFQKELAEAEALFLEARTHPLDLEQLEKNRATYSRLRLTRGSEWDFVQAYRDLIVASFGEADAFDRYLSDEEALFLVAVPRMGPPEVAGGVYTRKKTMMVHRDGKDIPLVIYEIDGLIIHPAFQGKGLSTLLQYDICSYLAGKHDPFVDVVIGFDNITTPAVFKVEAKLGYTLVTETAAACKISLKPLRWMVHGASIDEIMSYLLGKTLRKVYGLGGDAPAMRAVKTTPSL